ncbi:VOC family protein [Actinomadura madurae]|uniref:VOC family protein n=1 Tax=Actinomadura madurae TaxID=1993 RepID=UPI000D9AE5A4|nr:VOC family protein [Actinomadura madurae]SPT51249.1 Manganese-dependent 2,3-dihydroxybiphenyl 1,2-dioxygenase [Actinomadura madurae]
MALHGLNAITIGVPNVAETSAYYEDFGLEPLGGGRFATLDGGEQFTVAHALTRRVLDLTVGADDLDDIARIEARLRRHDYLCERGPDSVTSVEPVIGVSVTVAIRPRVRQTPPEPTGFNVPGRAGRPEGRSPVIDRAYRPRPRRLGHVVMGSTDWAASRDFFVRGLGFRVSDEVAGHAVFMRCSTDHHNVLVQKAPVAFLHHTSWQVDDVDDVGRAATTMLEGHPERHVWGLGRHHLGSNFFWYLRDPAGNFSEYYSDMDAIVDDQLWKPEVWEGAKSLYNWGPPPPPSFLAPEDLSELMTGAHSAG